MSLDPNVLHRANRRLAQRKAQREAQQAKRRAEIYRRCPRAAQIDRELRQTAAGIVSAAFRAGEDPIPALNRVRAENQALQAERTQLLRQAGYPADALDDTPYCASCGDTGWIGTDMCACLCALYAEEQMKELSKLLDLGEQSFDSFSLDYYSDQPWPGESESPRARIELIRDVCYSYASRFPKFAYPNLFLTGAPGLGKTFLSACIARMVAEKGFSVVYDTAINIFSKFEEQKFARAESDVRDAKDETRRYLGCDLLILDDLGSEMTTPFVQSALYSLVNGRIPSKRTVISSNLSIGDVRRRYSAQTASRLEGEYHVLPFFGEDIRLLKKQRR